MSQIENSMFIRPGEVWLDTGGEPIQAHGGGMLYYEGSYYWYGENKSAATCNARTDVVGVSCYCSTDLARWDNKGIVLAAMPEEPEHDLHPSKVLERPMVIYNEATRTFVMWLHSDEADYSGARAGVAVSKTPDGPFRYLGSVRPNDMMSRDMTVFVDDDREAYLFYSSEHNSTLHIVRLSGDYLSPTESYTRQFPDSYREAPAVFKDKGCYYLITSGCTGWEANAAEYAIAEHPLGPWTVMGNPCTGSEVETTFRSQSTFVFPAAGSPGQYIFMADRWNSSDLGDSRYMWLPVTTQNGQLSLGWRDEWKLPVSNKGGDTR
ncbi:glycoside hydrolase family 43 protein [Paenibacillus donghaensis]|uniref:Glycosyl hydrolase family 43 n=1 Tax=Paenibacillus donghaensis TaxID=414771 RepID=A0A2Z2KM24_9BACL|nr:glycoside hydrolase family 43 protein [Paenibacillus donghaensis]ASA19678.1 glycosyl hydrolase family 43 [Paenibacillus donghaensis]